LIAVKAPGAACSKEEILAFMAQKVPRWQLPDDVVFADELPLTATGKVAKRLLRERFAAAAAAVSGAAGDPPPNGASS
jgi:fatty-acyl-CoA synthase